MKMEYDVRSHALAMSITKSNLLTVTLGFFDDIYVPLIYLPEPSAL